MFEFMVLVLVGVVVWIARRLNRLQEEVESSRFQLSALDREMRRFKETVVSAGQGTSPQPFGSSKEAFEPGPMAEEAAPLPPSWLATSEPSVPEPQPQPAGASTAPAQPPPIKPIPPLVATPAPALSTLPPLSAPQSSFPVPVKSLPVVKSFDWEQFMGAKLYMWIGGFALFLAVAFFVKYSFDKDLISPEMQVALAYLAGAGLLVGGLSLRKKAYQVAATTLAATGVVVLYAVSFAAYKHYHFFGTGTTFLLMTLVTATGFLLADRLRAQVFAVLGMLTGFLIPPLLSTGENNPLGLFGYIALLDAGLIAVAFRRRWHHLLGMAALGTVIMQYGWVAKFFSADQIYTAMAVYLGFGALFLGALAWYHARDQVSEWVTGTAVAMLASGVVFLAITILDNAAVGSRPGVVFSFLLGIDLGLLAIAWLRPEFRKAQYFAGLVAYGVLALWTLTRLNDDLLNWALGGYLGFAVLHTVLPRLLPRFQEQGDRGWVGAAASLLGLSLALLPVLKGSHLTDLFWPVIALFDLMIVLVAFLSGAILVVAAAVLLTGLVTGSWILATPHGDLGLMALLVVVGMFAVLFFGVSLWLGKRVAGKERKEVGSGMGLDLGSLDPGVFTAAFSAVLPFLLLIMAIGRMELPDPSPIFGLAALLVIMLLALARLPKLDMLALVGLACVFLVELAWNQKHFRVDSAFVPLVWYTSFMALFTVYAFLFHYGFTERLFPWIASALSGPVHFLLVYPLVKKAYPNPAMGLLPASFAIPMLVALAMIARWFRTESPQRNRLLAWFGGSALLFITLIFPIQFDRQWLTLAWALEGAALLWLYHRVPHWALRATGLVLLTIAFVRLSLNPAVLHYHERSETRILNWYLYTYGVTVVCLMLGARAIQPPDTKVLRLPAVPILYTLGTILAFLLLNIEIADYFSEGSTITFDFSGNFARDMTYSISWGLFALLLLVVGVVRNLRAPRYAATALLGVVLLKLFLRDLVQLGALYRIGAFFGVAVISITAAVMYQRFFAVAARNAAPAGNPPPSPTPPADGATS